MKSLFRFKSKMQALLVGLLVLVTLSSCGEKVGNTEECASLNEKYKLTLSVDNEAGQLYYSVLYKEEVLVKQSSLSFLLDGGGTIGSGLKFSDVERTEVSQTWKPLYGERNEYPENYRSSIVSLEDKESGEEVMKIHMRAYDEGVAFRYELLNCDTKILEEYTEFALEPNYTAWVTEESQGIISEMSIDEIDGRAERPLLIKASDSKFLAIGEAAQIDYPRMKISSTDVEGTLVSSLGSGVETTGTLLTPWRFVMAGRNAGDILENNYLLLNLNEANKIEDTSWIKPGKVIRDVTLTTEGGKACIDFAAEHGLQYVIESAGWYGDEFTKEADAATVSVDPKRSTGPLDLQEVIKYGEEKGIDILVYVNRNQLEKQLDEILPLYQEWGLKGIKYGFVRTGDQEWSSWMHEAVRKAADHEMVLSIHDDYRPTGYSRTYPNLMTQEGIRGDEESPTNEHLIKTMFTRMIAGAGDHTVCYFAPRVDEMGSHATQLAKSVCVYSPLLWLYWYDRPEAAPKHIGGAGGFMPIIKDVPELEFFDKLPTVWDDTKVIHSDMGILGTIARRSGDNWFIGSVNGRTDRVLNISLNFLEPGKNYEAVIYYDDASLNTITNVGIEKMEVTNKTKISRDVFKNNGVAIMISPVE